MRQPTTTIRPDIQKSIARYAKRLGVSATFRDNYVYLNGETYQVEKVFTSKIMLRTSAFTSRITIPYSIHARVVPDRRSRYTKALSRR